jgi:hypothetical protein
MLSVGGPRRGVVGAVYVPPVVSGAWPAYLAHSQIRVVVTFAAFHPYVVGFVLVQLEYIVPNADDVVFE